MYLLVSTSKKPFNAQDLKGIKKKKRGMKIGTILLSSIIIVFTVVYVADQKRDAAAKAQQQVNQTITAPEQPLLNETTNQTSEKLNSIPLATLRKHSTQQDCWIGYQGKAYDITAWLPKHPGSAAAIAPYCGTAEEFEAAFKDQHGTSQVKRLLEEGILKGDIV